WTPQRLRDELERCGLVYEARADTRGLILKSLASPLSWGEARDLVLTLSARTRLPRGLLLVAHMEPAWGLVLEEEGELLLRPLYLRGRPDDLRAIAAAVGQ